MVWMFHVYWYAWTCLITGSFVFRWLYECCFESYNVPYVQGYHFPQLRAPEVDP